MEVFDIMPRGFSEKAAEDEFMPAEGDGMRGVSGEVLLGPKLMLCTMFKNEATYLEEWLQYHQLLGVSKVKRVSVCGCITLLCTICAM